MSEWAKLNWQCRRGTLELDRLLQGYLDTAYATATPAEQSLFKSLLAQEDSILLATLLGDQKPSAALQPIIDKIKLTEPKAIPH